MSIHEKVPIDTDETGEPAAAEAHILKLEPEQLAHICEAARQGIQEVIPITIGPDTES